MIPAEYDYLFDFVAGMNGGESPRELEHNQLAYALNLTVRGAFAHARPPNRKLTLSFASTDQQLAFTKGLYQGACYYKPDAGSQCLIASISGRLYKVTPVFPGGTTATVTDITGGNAQSTTATQCWLWQAENYVIWNDGSSLPVFYDGTSTTRSTGSGPPPAASTFIVSPSFSFPNGYNGIKAAPDTITFTLATNFTGLNGDSVILGLGSTTPLYGVVTAGAGTPAVTAHFGLQTIGAPFFVGSGTTLTIAQIPVAPQLPAGRMGTYGKGRVWMCLANGKDFIAGDIVGGPSGSKANNFRDAILNITENDFLTGGGTFTVPGSIGDIRAMRFVAILDASLGQGPLQVFTPNAVFSCNAPVDRLTWQTLSNPILTEPLIGSGGLGQNSTVPVNGDTFFRSVDGIRTLVLARRDFATWGNVPISREVAQFLESDEEDLLPYGSAINFDNRLLMTFRPVSTAQGVYHRGLIVINFDPVSTITGKLPPVYDGAWNGLNVLQVLSDQFNLIARAYAFNLNTGLSEIELWEILPSSEETLILDNGTTPISWAMESATLFDLEDKQPVQRHLKSLDNGELYVSDLEGRVDFRVMYRPDDWPCWVLWLAWSECASMTAENSQPQFRPRMGLGTPSARDCDPSTNRPLREGFSFQFRIEVVGHCTIKGARFSAQPAPQPKFPPPNCKPLC